MAEPHPESSPSSRFSWGLAGVTLLWLGITAALLWFLVPEFGQVYDQVKVPKRTLTEWVVSASRTACGYPFPFALAILMSVIWVGTWKGAHKKAGEALLPVAVVATFVALIFGLFLPLCGGLLEGPVARQADYRCDPTGRR